MGLRFVFLLITRLAVWLRLSRREETWKTAEILILRHQLAVLQRQPRRPKLNWADRALLAALLGVIPKARRQGLRLLVDVQAVTHPPGAPPPSPARVYLRIYAGRVTTTPRAAPRSATAPPSSPPACADAGSPPVCCSGERSSPMVKATAAAGAAIAAFP